jgi:hypothetical protein
MEASIRFIHKRSNLIHNILGQAPFENGNDTETTYKNLLKRNINIRVYVVLRG